MGKVIGEQGDMRKVIGDMEKVIDDMGTWGRL